MTAVEFFDRSPLENIISAITTRPDKIIFIGDGRIMGRLVEVYTSFLRRRGLDTILELRDIHGKSIDGIARVLSDIVESEESCIFEVTGGSEQALVAMGIVFERYRDRDIQMQYFRVRGNRVVDCDNDGAVILEETPELDVREVIGIHGGVASFESYGTGDGRPSAAFTEDIGQMWEVCRKAPRIWNFHSGVISSLSNMSTADGLSVSVSSGRVASHLNGDRQRMEELHSLLSDLASCGILKDYVNDGRRVSFRFKSAQVRKCLTKAGTVLELTVLSRAMALTGREGAPYYTDGLSGVRIDWDGQMGRGGPHDTENEIDVILTRGVTPVFISCKNGHIDDGELYKLDAVAARFGGEYAKKVLVCTDPGRSEGNMGYMRQRARDMKINLVENVHKMTDAQLDKMLREL